MSFVYCLAVLLYGTLTTKAAPLTYSSNAELTSNVTTTDASSILLSSLVYENNIEVNDVDLKTTQLTMLRGKVESPNDSEQSDTSPVSFVPLVLTNPPKLVELPENCETAVSDIPLQTEIAPTARIETVYKVVVREDTSEIAKTLSEADYLFDITSNSTSNDTTLIPALQCQEGDIQRNNHCYKIAKKMRIGFDSALQACKAAKNGSLASVRGKNEHEFIVDALSKSNFAHGTYLIGAVFVRSTGVWTWTDGSSFNEVPPMEVPADWIPDFSAVRNHLAYDTRGKPMLYPFESVADGYICKYNLN